MTDAVFYDGRSARRRTVSLQLSASALGIHDGEELIASWPVALVRSTEAPDGTLRLMLDDEALLARLDVVGQEDQAAIREHCLHVDSGARKERTGRILVWSAAAAASLALSVLFLVPIAADRLTPLIPASVERHLGRAVDNQIRLVFGSRACTHELGAAVLETLGARLRSAGDPAPDAEIVVLDSRAQNAIALPGGRIYLFSGLLHRAESADEIAGVVAHEMGHVAHRDGLRKLIQSGGTSYLLGLLFGDVTGGAAIVAATRMLVDSAYSRDAEAAADAFAGTTMAALGRPADAMGHLLKRIDGNESPVPAFLSAHPVTDQRLKTLERQRPAHPGAPILADEEWRALKEICKTS